jgi:hypothetical protein
VGGLFFAWAIGEGIIGYRWAKLKAPPTPGVLLIASGIFLGCAILAEYSPARPLATAFAFTVDLGVLMQVVGKAPTATTGWPPPSINDPSVLLPSGKATVNTATTAA